MRNNIIIFKKLPYCFFLLLIIIFLLWSGLAFAQESEETDKPQKDEAKKLEDFMDDSMQEIDFYTLEELLNVEVAVASLFEEDELVVGSTVSSITPEQWKRLGARRLEDALASELSVVLYPYIIGVYSIAIRGYATNTSHRGTAYLIDGIPVNNFSDSAMGHLPEFNIGTLDKIEMIKGPGSAIYGTDAFHGVVAMKTFESDKDYYSIEAAGAYPMYGDANVKISQGFADNLFRINAAASTSGQPPLEQKYEYDYPGTGGVLPTDPEKGSGKREISYIDHTGVLKLDIKPGDKLNIGLSSYINYFSVEGFPGVSVYPLFGSLCKNDMSGQEALFVMGVGRARYSFNNNLIVEAVGYSWRDDQKADFYTDKFKSKSFDQGGESHSGAYFIIKQPDNAMNLQWLIAYSFAYNKILIAKQQYLNWNPDPVVIANFGGYGTKTAEGDHLYAGKDRTINSVYGQTKWGAIKNSLYAILGFRLDNYSDYGNQFTPRGGLVFLPTSSSSIKALYGRAFRAAAAAEVYGIMNYTNVNKDIKPETIDTYELICMYKEKKCKISISGYYSQWKNGIIQEFNSNLFVDPTQYPYNTVNKGKNDSFGGEFALFYSFDLFSADLGFSYVKSRAFDAIRTDFNAPIPVDIVIDEEDYAAFPEYSAKAGLYYTLNPVGLDFFLNNRIYYKMKETHYNKKDDPADLSLYWLMSLNIHKIIEKKTEIILDINNILNRKNKIPSINGADDGYLEPGISVMLRAGYKI